jgi:hypothetical protein
LKPWSACGTEAARQGAADLGRDAKRATVGLGDEDRLDPVAGANLEQELARAVDGGLLGDQRGRTDLCHLRELLAQALGQIGHLLEILRAALMQPAQHLPGAIGFLADGLEPGSQPLEIEIEQIQRE